MTASILVVDDMEPNRRLMQAKLEAKYYTVFLAADGPHALESAARHQPDIILLDVMMPGMDGYEVCRRLKSNLATRHIPIVMLTALTDRDDRLRGLEAGADDFLSKPIDDFGLFARLEALMRYNMVANELRTRDAAGARQEFFSEFEREMLDKPASVLVIDQNNHEARRIAKSLEKVGHTAATWMDAQSSGIRFDNIDIVFIALSEQRHDALKLCAHLRALKEARDFSIIVSCSPEEQKKGIEALRIGASDLVATPLDVLELQARVRTQTRRKRFVDVLRQRVDRGLELSVIDPLTGLYNRRYMLERLQLWMQRSGVDEKPLSIVAFDIDHFKAVNDRHGHEAGDKVLQNFAARLRTNIRPQDIACRPGGEEFLLIMPDTREDLAQIGAERIREAIAAEPFYIERDDEHIKVTVSAGVATYRGEGGVLADFLHQADQALYRAKQNGRNRIETIAA
ncbi:MAG: PleD family two-component system response regulator [Pseudomonadota bacterium]